MKNSILLITIISFFSFAANANDPTYYPFATSEKDIKIKSTTVSKNIEGTKEDDYIIASPEGSRIFAKGGLNYITLKNGKDQVYFSLCSTKIINNEVSVIENFDIKNDKLVIFCGHHKIEANQLNIIHANFKNKPITYVHVKGKHSDSAFALLGNIDLKVSDITLNEPFKKD